MALETNYEETASNPKFFDDYQQKKSELEILMSQWEYIQSQIEEFNI